VVVVACRAPLQAENILTREELLVIFADVHLLVEVNRMLLEDMAKRVRRSEGRELGESFILLVRITTRLTITL
jgi:hypothetical protein